MSIHREDLATLRDPSIETGQWIEPTHPGEHLAELLADLNVTQYRLAKDIQVPARRINEIVKGERSISADTALRLGHYFGMSAEYWLGLQAAYDLQNVRMSLGEDLEKLPHLAA